jgi:hypothetical protein
MAIIQDAKGRPIPSWARWVKTIAAAGSDSGYKEDNGNQVPFSIYLYDDSTINFTTVEGAAATVTFGAGYHPIAFGTIVSTSAAALMLFAYKPQGA